MHAQQALADPAADGLSGELQFLGHLLDGRHRWPAGIWPDRVEHRGFASMSDVERAGFSRSAAIWRPGARANACSASHAAAEGAGCVCPGPTFEVRISPGGL